MGINTHKKSPAKCTVSQQVNRYCGSMGFSEID